MKEIKIIDILRSTCHYGRVKLAEDYKGAFHYACLTCGKLCDTYEYDTNVSTFIEPDHNRIIGNLDKIMVDKSSTWNPK